MFHRIAAACALLLAPTPAFATYGMTCTGKGNTPSVEITLGSSDFRHVTGIALFRGPTPLAASGGGGLTLLNKSQRPELLLGRLVNPKGAVVAQVRLQQRKGGGPLVGVLLYEHRRYWLICGELG